jgi:hypothetical protein
MEIYLDLRKVEIWQNQCEMGGTCSMFVEMTILWHKTVTGKHKGRSRTWLKE